ncbi:MAG: endonuclease/exonuclease/phosphatase family protein, partial [Acidobacteriota bacterium]
MLIRMLLLAVLATPIAADPKPSDDGRLRVAVFNVWELSAQKVDGGAPQLAAAAEIVQRTRPDILLVNEIDFDSEARVATT